MPVLTAKKAPKRLWIGGYGPEKSAHGDGLAAFRDHVMTATWGQLEVDVTWNIMDEGRPNTDLFDLVESGRMFLCYFSSSYLGHQVEELNVLETPFLFDSLETAHRALDGALGSSLRAAVRSKTPFEALGFWDNGFRHMTNLKHPIHTPADCRGLSVRMQPNIIHEALIRSWGAIPVAVELSEAVQLIVSRNVDAQENPLANTVAYGVDKVHPFVTMTGHLYGARGLFANRAVYEAFPDDLRAAVDEAVVKAIFVQRSAAAKLEKTLRHNMEIDGIEFVDLDEAEIAAFREASQPAIDLAVESVPGDLHELVAT
jgi:TRAP-type C4-dicarboxylate transport system substrate-binding protein